MDQLTGRAMLHGGDGSAGGGAGRRRRAAGPAGRAAARAGGARRRAGRDAGFTLVEVLVVIAILGLLIGLVGPAALRQLGGARQSVARQSIERLATVLDIYRIDVGDYPTTEQGLAALVAAPAGASGWNGPYIKGEGVPHDPWNRPFRYRAPSSRGGNHEFDLCSAGASGQAGEPGQDGSICNR